MNIRNLLFLHVPIGLKLESVDLERLLAPELDPFSIGSVLGALKTEAARVYCQKNADWIATARAILAKSDQHGIRWSSMGDHDYPASWFDLRSRPVIFSYMGEACWQTTPLLAVVGSRTPASDSLLWMQRELSEFLHQRKVGVVSGGARGVDQWAHRLSLDCGQPTVCVLPSGLLNPYPDRHEDLWKRVVGKGGCMMSTCGLSEPMRKSFFHIRNRWIAGLSPGCVVVEANRRSGSLLTAKLCIEENREVATLPVFPTATQGLGNLDLLEAGATMLRDHRDLITFWDCLSEGSFQTVQRKEQEQNIDHPQAD